MKKEYEIGTVTPSVDSDIEKRLLDAYQAIQDALDQLELIEKTFKESLPDTIDVCNIGELLKTLNNTANSLKTLIAEFPSKLTEALSGDLPKGQGLQIAAGMEKSAATGIRLKRFQIIKMRLNKFKLVVERKIYIITRDILKWTITGKGSKETSYLQTPLATLSSVAAVANTIMTALGVLLTFVENLVPLNVKAASCCFFMTPKSLKKVDITIANVNSSTTNTTPEPIDKALGEAEAMIDKANKIKKDTFIAASAATGSSSAMSGAFSFNGLSDFDKFDSETIIKATRNILSALVDADPLPRYEKLSIANPRFLVYLATGLEPSAKQCFGLPGFP